MDVRIYVSGKYIGNMAQANVMESTVLSTSAVGRAGSIRTNRLTLRDGRGREEWREETR